MPRKAKTEWNGEDGECNCRNLRLTLVDPPTSTVSVQAVLLYGSETWALPQAALIPIRSFHHRSARYITGNHIRPLGDDLWFLPRSSEVLAGAGLFSIDEYIRRRRSTVSAWVQGREIYRRCLGLDSRGGSPTRKVWWRL